MRRGLLILNPEATRVSHRTRDVIAHALSAELKLDIAETKRRNHATHLASGAAHEGYDVVVCFGGDGTLNEVINGLAGTDVPLVPIPGGGTNVFARTMGLPKNPIEATSIVLEHLHDGTEPRRINLGRMNGRMFSFGAGAGLDAQGVRCVPTGGPREGSRRNRRDDVGAPNDPSRRRRGIRLGRLQQDPQGERLPRSRRSACGS